MNSLSRRLVQKAPVRSPIALIAKSAEDRTNNIRRLAYQVPETDGVPCGRSFEDAFILANMDLFGLGQVPQPEKEARAWTEAERVRKKSDFALEYAITKTAWVVPKYIAEGLRWLAEGVRLQGPAFLPQAPEPKAIESTPPREKEADA